MELQPGSPVAVPSSGTGRGRNRAVPLVLLWLDGLLERNPRRHRGRHIDDGALAPGGAYLTHAHREDQPVAARFLGLGFDVFALRYRTYVPSDWHCRFPRSLLATETRMNESLEHFLTAKDETAASWRWPSCATRRTCAPPTGPTSRRHVEGAPVGGLQKHACLGRARDRGHQALRVAGGGVVPQPVGGGHHHRGPRHRQPQEEVFPYVRIHGSRELCLFTNSELTCRFYAKSGFERFDERFFEHNGIRFGSWSFRSEL